MIARASELAFVPCYAPYVGGITSEVDNIFYSCRPPLLHVRDWTEQEDWEVFPWSAQLLSEEKGHEESLWGAPPSSTSFKRGVFTSGDVFPPETFPYLSWRVPRTATETKPQEGLAKIGLSMFSLLHFNFSEVHKLLLPSTCLNGYINA